MATDMIKIEIAERVMIGDDGLPMNSIPKDLAYSMVEEYALMDEHQMQENQSLQNRDISS